MINEKRLNQDDEKLESKSSWLAQKKVWRKYEENVKKVWRG